MALGRAKCLFLFATDMPLKTDWDKALNRMVELAEKLPERYREVCFRLLLEAYLKDRDLATLS